MHEAIRSLTAQKVEHVTRRDQIKSEIASVQANIRQKREAQAAHQRALDEQARHNLPELQFWENCLAMRIEATGVDDRLRFLFLHIDERDAGRECWFDFQIGRKDYTIVSTKPRLDKEDVEAAQERLNETQELGVFLKSMRTLFAEAVTA